MTMATIDAGVFQMGAPEYVVQVALDGSRFRSGQIFMVDDAAGKGARFELIDADTKATARLYTPVPFSSGVATIVEVDETSAEPGFAPPLARLVVSGRLSMGPFAVAVIELDRNDL